MRRLVVNALLLIASIFGGILSLPVMVGQIVFRLFSSQYDLPYYMRQIAIANDTAAGSMIYGSRHTISAITGAKAAAGSRWHRWQAKMIDALFYPGHCRVAAVTERMITYQGVPMSNRSKSNAIMHEDELLEYFGDADNHYLYQQRDDGTVVCWMCCDFEIVRQSGKIDRGGCGDGFTYDPNTHSIQIEGGN